MSQTTFRYRWGPRWHVALARRAVHRLLSIDGGGVRGVVALEVLARIEQVLRDETGDPELVLGDWFDYVGGTSTGAIIAGGVALGLPVSRIQQLYRENMRSIFTRAGIFDLVRARYDEAGIETVLRREFGEDTHPRLDGPALPAAARAAQHQHRLAVAGEQQPGRPLQPGAGLQPRPPAVAAGPGQLRGADVLRPRGGRRRRRRRSCSATAPSPRSTTRRSSWC